MILPKKPAFMVKFYTLTAFKYTIENIEKQ